MKFKDLRKGDNAYTDPGGPPRNEVRTRPAEVYVVPGAELLDIIEYPDGRVIELPPVHNVIQTKFGPLLAALISGTNTTAITYMEVGTGDPGWDAAPPPPAPSVDQTGLLAPIVRAAPASWAYLLGDNSLAANTTSTTTVAPGSVVVTPVSMTGITNGIILVVGSAGASELVTVTASTGTTFTATFLKAHGPASYTIVHNTARVQATVTFGIGVANGTLREVAMWGGQASSSTVGGDLVNIIRHVAISKPSGGQDFSLTRKMVFQF